MKSNKLAACIKLAHKVTVYVPGTFGAASAGDTSEWIARAASLLSSRFGGATSSPAVGYWLSDVHGLIRENTTIVFAYAAEQALESGPQRMTLVSFNSIGLPVCSHYTVYTCNQRSYAQYENALVLEVIGKGGRYFDELSLHEGNAFALFLGWVNSGPAPAETYILGYDKARLYRSFDSITAPKLGENSERMYAAERQNKPKIYKVVTMSPGDRFEQRVFNSLEELLKVYEQAGTLCDNVRRLELQGQPRLKGLYGPMYDGEENGAAVIRYESPEVYKILST